MPTPTPMNILVINAGSSSLKIAVIDPADGAVRFTALAERLGVPNARLRCNGEMLPLPTPTMTAALSIVVEQLRARGDLALDGIGHRVVHGGEHFTASALIDDGVVAAISACATLAPLHNPANLECIALSRRLFPMVPQVAVFDTAFHQTMPEVAWRYAVPEAWYREHGVRRYGFHGTSHRFVAARAAELLGRPLNEVKLITAHLGNGCSVCAIDHGCSIDTTMGMTPLEGLVMGTRSGDLDIGVVAHIAQATGMDAPAIVNVLNKQSGLLGLSGLSNDMRTLTQAAVDGHAGAQMAVAVFVYRLAKHIGALAIGLDGCDALVFTGGIGEHSAVVRAATLARLGVLGLHMDPALNADDGRSTNGRISSSTTPVALVVPTNEELLIARDTAALIAPTPPEL